MLTRSRSSRDISATCPFYLQQLQSLHEKVIIPHTVSAPAIKGVENTTPGFVILYDRYDHDGPATGQRLIVDNHGQSNSEGLILCCPSQIALNLFEFQQGYCMISVTYSRSAVAFYSTREPSIDKPKSAESPVRTVPV